MTTNKIKFNPFNIYIYTFDATRLAFALHKGVLLWCSRT